MLVRKGPRAAAAYVVRTGRVRERILGSGLPHITIREVLKRLRGSEPFTLHVNPLHTANISSDPLERHPNYLIGLLAGAVRPRNALEIGTGSGKSTFSIAAQLQEDGSLITVDAPLEWHDPSSYMDDATLTETSNFTRAYRIPDWDSSPLVEKITAIREDSRSLDYSRFDFQFDFVFIDGSHSEEAVRQDTEQVIPYLADGAVLLWHDYGSSKLSHGVTAYLHEFSARSRWPVHVIEYTTLAIQIRR